METMGVKVGQNVKTYAEKVNSARINKAEKYALESFQSHRIALRNARSLENDLM